MPVFGGFMNEKGWTLIELITGFAIVGVVIFWIAIIYVALHFIGKFW
jgi:Tfp pilus assembly protein PilE